VPKRGEGAVDFLRERAGALNVSAAKARDDAGWGVVLTVDGPFPDRRTAARVADRLRFRLAEVLEREGVERAALEDWERAPYDPGASVRRPRAGQGGAP
jgi:hypothetical protein